jgi:hypothetical protein
VLGASSAVRRAGVPAVQPPMGTPLPRPACQVGRGSGLVLLGYGWAREHIQREASAQQPGPVQARRPLLGVFHPGWLGCCHQGPARLWPRLGLLLRAHPGPQFRAWGEDAVEPREVGSRRRHQARHAT